MSYGQLAICNGCHIKRILPDKGSDYLCPKCFKEWEQQLNLTLQEE